MNGQDFRKAVNLTNRRKLTKKQLQAAESYSASGRSKSVNIRKGFCEPVLRREQV